ncbi:MAG: hypothetical protein ACRKGH_00465 [Dehalogenimonas sp.]
MRADKSDPYQRYINFWDWLRVDWHPAWVLAIVFGYIYYLMTTYEL